MNWVFWSGAAATPVISLTPQPPPPFGLTYYDRTGLTVDCAAHIIASGDATWWATAQRGGTDTVPAEGELGLSASQALITRIFRNATGTRVTINDNNPLDFSQYFGPSGSTSERTMKIQTDETTIVSTGQIQSSGGNFVVFEFDAGDAATILGITDGDGLNFAIDQVI